jgi:hypothetical protein
MIVEKFWFIVEKIGEKSIAVVKRIDSIVDVIAEKMVDAAIRTFDDDDME